MMVLMTSLGCLFEYIYLTEYELLYKLWSLSCFVNRLVIFANNINIRQVLIPYLLALHERKGE